jgi:Na+/alanine symporter
MTRPPQILYFIAYCALSPKSILGDGKASTATIATIAATAWTSCDIFSRKVGLGTAAIAAAKINSPAKRGLISMAEALFNVIVCPMTCLVIVIATATPFPFQGAMLTSWEFGHGLRMPTLGKFIVGARIILFACTTTIGWNYSGR